MEMVRKGWVTPNPSLGQGLPRAVSLVPRRDLAGPHPSGMLSKASAMDAGTAPGSGAWTYRGIYI